MDSDPRNLDGSDSPSSIQAPPPGYTKFKEGLKATLLLLAGLDQASLAMLKYDEEYQRAVQTFLVPLSSIPISEIVGQAMKSGLDAAISHISNHVRVSPVPPSMSMSGPRLFTPGVPPDSDIPGTAHPSLHVTPSMPQSSTTTQSPFFTPLHGGEHLPPPPASPLHQGSRLKTAPINGLLGLAPAPQPVSRGQVATSWQGRLATMYKAPLPSDSQDNLVSVYVIHLMMGEWKRQNPLEGLIDRLNTQMDRQRNRITSSPPFLAGCVSPPSQDRIIEGFMGQDGGRTIILVCPRQTTHANGNTLLCDLQDAVDEVRNVFLTVRSNSYLTTQLAVPSIDRDLIKRIF